MHASPPLALLFLAAALFGLAQFAWGSVRREAYLASAEAHAVHVVMNGVMAVMAARFYGPAAEWWVISLLFVTIIMLAGRLSVHFCHRDGRSASGTVYHLFGLAAMLYAIRLMPADVLANARMTMPHLGWAAVTLVLLFAIDAAATAVLALAFPRTLLRLDAAAGGPVEDASPRTIRIIRASAVPHLVMDAGMVLMLL